MNKIVSNLQLNATTIKIIAIILMVFDHIHQMFIPMNPPMWFTWLGRPVFPMFLFVMAESFHYTHSRKKFLSRLLLGAWFMIIFNAILSTVLRNPNNNVNLINNAFMTFFVAGLYMLFWDMLVIGIKERNVKKIIVAILLCFVPVLTMVPGYLLVRSSLIQVVPFWVFRVILTMCMMLPNVLIIEGGYAMFLLGLLFYILRKWRWAQIIVLIALSALVFIMSEGSNIQWLMVFAVIPMLLYDGEKGFGIKRFFYIFYPAHIYLLYIAATLIATVP